MNFNSFGFLLYFLPIVMLLYFCVPRRFLQLRNLVLLGFSLAFYAWAGFRFLPLLALSIAIHYVGGLLAGGGTNRRRSAALAVCVLLDLALLGWFKYAGFFADILGSAGVALTLPQIAMPIGISFYTFQGISYVADVKAGKVAPQKNPLNVAFYLVFFPRLVAGPIVRYDAIGPALAAREESAGQVADGLVRFCFGLGKKVLLSGALGEIAGACFSTHGSRLTISLSWLGALAYTMQIYFDFSGYSDMAIGLGRVFGFHFPENFNFPYIANSVTDFWRRWHMTLSSWFRDYVYIPLGGSRVSRIKCLRNLALVWLLTGLWHGAAWTFVAWGAWFLVFLMGERYVWGGVLKKAPAPVRHGYTLLLVILSWVLFRARSLPEAAAYMGAMFGIGAGGMGVGETVYYLCQYWPELLVGLFACLPVKNWVGAWLERRAQRPLATAISAWGPKVLALLLLALSYMKMTTGSFSPFIYFQF